MRKYAIAGALALVVGGVSYYALFVEPSRQMRAGLDEAIRTLPPGITAHYDGAHYSLLTHNASINGLSIKAGGAYAGDYAVAKLSISHPNLNLESDWKHAALNPAALAQDQALAVADRVAVEGVSIHSTIADGSLAATSAEKPRLYPWALLHPGLPQLNQLGALFSDMMQAQLAANQEQKKQREQGQTTSLPEFKAMERRQFESLMPLVHLEAGVVLGFGIDGLDMTDFKYVIHHPAMGNLPAGDFNVAINNAHEGAFDRGVLSEVSADGVTENIGPLAAITIDHMVERQISVRAPLLRALNNEPLSLALLDGAAVGSLEANGISETLPTAQNIKIQTISLSDIAFDHSMLASGAFKFDGFKISKDMLPDPKAKLAFQQFGLDAVTVNLDAGFKWDADKKIAKISAATLKIDELGSLTLNADVAGIIPGNPDEQAVPTLVGGSLRYDDGSLIDRLLGMGGKRTPEQIAQIRQAFATNLVKNSGLAQQNDPKMAASLRAVADFAKTPRSLTITAAPPSPVVLADLKSIGATGFPALFGMLGLSIAANQ
jgi:hypothetical protein